MNGGGIPFRKFRCDTLEEFLAGITDLRMNRVGSEVFVNVRANEKIAHIDKLVQQQRKPKKKKVRIAIVSKFYP